MATKLSLYQGALLEVGERDLASLTENREPRRLLDRVWDNGAVDYCLGRGQWSFAKRSLQLTPSTTITPAFGYQYAYEVPTDHIRTTSLCSDEYGNVPLLAYTLESGVWYSDINPLFVSYVSNDAAIGGDLSLWPADFTRAVETYLASRIVRKLTQSDKDELMLFKKANQMFKDAASSDAAESPTRFPPPGNWVLSRHGNSRGERGNRGSLIG